MASTVPDLYMTFEGSNCLRQRLILSTLTGRAVKINQIRAKHEEPGIVDYEVTLLQLLDKITNGTTIKIDETGTELRYKPGVLHGGRVEHDCGTSRSISYFLEFIFALAPFCKNPLDLTLHGVTNDSLDPSVDALKASSIPVIKRSLGAFEEDQLELKLVHRGLKPDGGGKVFFKCPVRRVLKPFHHLDQGKIKRIRGVAYSCRVSPQMANRMVDVAKGILLKFIPDIYIHTDHTKGKQSGNSPGFGINLIAETTTGCIFTGEAVSKASNMIKSTSEADKKPSTPEDVALQATSALLEDIYHGGAVNTINQSLTCLFMALCTPDLSKVCLGPLSSYTIHFLRHLRAFLDLTFKLDQTHRKSRTDAEDDEMLAEGADKLIAACLGVGFSNMNKKAI